jgi:hypothetical protein
MLLEQPPKFRRAIREQNYGYRPGAAADRDHVLLETQHHAMNVSMGQLLETVDCSRHATVADRVQRVAPLLSCMVTVAQYAMR